MAIEMKVSGLMLDPLTNMPIVILRNAAGDRLLPIWIGPFEAQAIAMKRDDVTPPRPMTHDLLRNVIQDLSARVERIVVCELKENTFYARIHLQTGKGPLEVDARPSDAIALALRTSSPIYVEESVIQNAHGMQGSTDSMDVERVRKWLDGLSDDELGKYKM